MNHALREWYSSQLRLKRLRAEQAKRTKMPPDPWERFRGDPVGFITKGLEQCQEDSWWGWRVIIKAAYAYPLDTKELEFFRSVAERDPPPHRVRELWLITGRRGGKDSIASLISLYCGMYCDIKSMRPGERALVACFATDKDQAGIVFSYIRGYFQSIPALRTYLEGELGDSYRTPVRLKRKVDVAVVTNNFRAPRGRPIAAAIFDECGFWKSDESTTPDVETLNAVQPGMGTIPDAVLIGISSPHMEKGLLYDRFRRYYGTNDPEILIIRATTQQMNPMIDIINPGLIARAMDEDPERARAEYFAEFRRDLVDFISREVVESLIVRGRHELAPQKGTQYRAFFDASGGTNDSMALAIAHGEGTGYAVLDCLRERRPPFNPGVTIAEFSETLNTYNVQVVKGDRYAGIWPQAEWAKHGIVYEVSEQSKSEIYLALLPLLMSGRAELLDERRSIDQMCRLERRTVRAGRDTVDHPPKEHDDMSNVLAGALTMCAIDETRALWSASDLA